MEDVGSVKLGRRFGVPARRIVSSSFAGVSLRTVRSQVAALRSATPPLRFGPSGDCARRFAKKSAQEEESKRKSPLNLYDNVLNHTGFSHANIEPQTVPGRVLVVQF